MGLNGFEKQGELNLGLNDLENTVNGFISFGRILENKNIYII